MARQAAASGGVMSEDNLPVELPAILAEMTAIQDTMGTAAYVRNEGVQARYRQLVNRKNSFTESSILTGDSEALLPIASHAQFAAEMKRQGVEGADYGKYVSVMRNVADILMSVPAQDQPQLVRAFEALPDDVAGAAVAELLAHKPVVDWCSDEQVSMFAEMPEGALLVREWGNDARYNMAVVRARLFRVAEALDDEGDVEDFLIWHDDLSFGSKIALYRKLAA
jgi:hypothetical protein